MSLTSIETALRHRCARIHEEERKIPTSTFGAQKRPRRSFGRKGDGKRRSGDFKKTYYAEDGEEDQDEVDGEDLEHDESAYKAYVMNLDENGLEDEEDPEEDEDEEGDEESVEEELKEAWAAGWKAKSQQNEKKKFRGWKSSGKGQGSDGKDRRKVNSTCASCGEVGHWRGDPQCRNVKTARTHCTRRRRTLRPTPVWLLIKDPKWFTTPMWVNAHKTKVKKPVLEKLKVIEGTAGISSAWIRVVDSQLQWQIDSAPGAGQGYLGTQRWAVTREAGMW